MGRRYISDPGESELSYWFSSFIGPVEIKRVIDSVSRFRVNCTNEEARTALEKHKGDPAAAVLEILQPDPFQLDIKIIMEQVDCTKDQACEALKKNKGDVVDAVMDLSSDAEKNYYG